MGIIINEAQQTSGLCNKNRPVCAQNSLHNSIADPIIDGLPIIGTADEELVLRAEERQMAARYEVRANTGR